jgi:hypothetical protein
VVGTRATRLRALRRPTGAIVLLELSGPLEPGIGVPVPVSEVPVAVEPLAIGPRGLALAADVPPAEPVEEGAVRSISGPAAGIAGPALAEAVTPGTGIAVAVLAAEGIDTLRLVSGIDATAA